MSYLKIKPGQFIVSGLFVACVKQVRELKAGDNLTLLSSEGVRTNEWVTGPLKDLPEGWQVHSGDALLVAVGLESGE